LTDKNEMTIFRLTLGASLLSAPRSPPVEWAVAPGLTEYADAVAQMESRASAIAEGRASERVWLVEHPPLYTAGTSARDADLIDARFPVHRTGRGGQYTYHGPGQRVAYVMLDLKRRRPDVRAFVSALEGWLIDALAAFDIAGERRETRVGVWVRRPDKPPGVDGAMAEGKIAALGIRVRRWVSFHGVSLNVAPDLAHFSGIVPCGIGEAHYGITSLRDLGRAATMDEADEALRAAFERRFGATTG
jgi:lipoyl(octanoyl) transferase